MQKQKGSVLAYTLIVLSLMLVVALNMSMAALRSKQNSIATGNSIQAFQAADSGSQIMLKGININPGSFRLVDKFPSCVVSGGIATVVGVINNASYVVVPFKKQGANDVPMTSCNSNQDTTDKITKIKATGVFRGTSRAVEVSVSN
jgi:hypothetical protein